MHAIAPRWAWAVSFLALTAALVVAADPPAAEEIAIIDSAGKEIKLSNVKYTQGLRRLAWLGDPSATTDDGKKGPLAFEIREPNSTDLVKGIVTLVPLSSIEAVKYDYTKLTVETSIKGFDKPLVGTCKYKGFCVLGLDGEAGGVKAKFSGGTIKTGIKSVAFPNAKPLPARGESTAWTLKIEGAKPDESLMTVWNLKALYQLAGGVEQMTDALPVRKGEPIAFGGGGKPAGFKKLEVVAVDPNKKMVVVELDDGARTALVLAGEIDKKPAVLVGLVGEVDAGWKLFPLHTIAEVKPEGK